MRAIRSGKNRRVCRSSELELMRRVIGVIEKWNNWGRRDRQIERLTHSLTEETALTDRHTIAASQASIPPASGARDAEKDGIVRDAFRPSDNPIGRRLRCRRL
jgi:hypothetical protein